MIELKFKSKRKRSAALLGSAVSVILLSVSPTLAQNAQPAQTTPPAAGTPGQATATDPAQLKTKTKPAASAKADDKSKPQQPPAKPAAGAADAAPDSLHFNEVVVTGTSVAQEKFKAPYAITVLNPAQVAAKAPTSTADVLKGTPGLWVESTAGSAGSENIYARGLPGGSYQYFGLLEDGLPLYETNYETFMNADILERTDLGLRRVEIVRGGTAPIFNNNVPGGVANFITNHGTDTLQGAAKLTVGSNGLGRLDFTQSGPVNDNLQLAFSGFAHIDNGFRNPGFSGGDVGGQFKLAGTYLLENGKIWADVKYLNDKGIFYSDIPLTNPATGQSLANVINPHDGTLVSPSVDNVTLRILTPNGPTTLNRSLEDGIHSNVFNATSGIDLDLDDKTKLSDKFRIVSGEVDINYVLNGSFLTGGASGFSAQAFANNLASKVPGAVAGQYVIAGTNTVVKPTQDLALANVYTSAQSKFTDFINDTRLEHEFDTIVGRHDVSGGLYYSHYTFSQVRESGTYLSGITNNPPVYDVQALDANGNVLGKVTDNGFTSYGNGANGNVTGDALALYGADNWHITDAWQADAGLRREVEWEGGQQGQVTSQALAIPGVLVPITTGGATSFKYKNEVLAGTAWTLGTSYQASDVVNVFGRYTDSCSFPRFQNIYVGSSFNGKPLPVSDIKQAEGGIKFNWPGLSLFAVGFYNHFNPLITSVLVTDQNNNLTTQTVSAITTTKGIEFEGGWTPVKWFFVNGGLTLQHTEVSNIIAPGFSTAGINGKQEPRVPNVFGRIEPGVAFDYSDVKYKLSTTLSYIGVRYQDYNNLSRLPAYGTVDAALTAEYKNMTFGFHALNLTNSAGLTEGNARLSAVALNGNTPVSDATIGRPIYGRSFFADATIHW